MLRGGVAVAREQPGAVSLTLDEAIALGLKSNTELKVRTQQERFVHGQILSVGAALVPTLTASAYTQAQEINLVAMGFKPGTVKLPGFVIPEIVKVNTTNAQMSLSQQVFNVPAYLLFRSAQKAAEAANWATLSARGGVVLNVGGYYLRILADEATIRNSQALVKQDELVYEHARASKDAGVGINLDVLRAQVELQNEQQKLISAINAEAKDKIQLNRTMGSAGRAGATACRCNSLRRLRRQLNRRGRAEGACSRVCPAQGSARAGGATRGVAEGAAGAEV